MSRYTDAKLVLKSNTLEQATTALSMGFIFMGFNSYIMKAFAVGAFLLGAYVSFFVLKRRFRKFKRSLRAWRLAKA